MWPTRRALGFYCGLLLFCAAAHADEVIPTTTPGVLRVALYRDFPPYSQDGRGSDVDLAQALAAHLGFRLEIFWLKSDEDMSDDLRNAVWKGHYLGPRPADVMMHVPVDPALQRANPKVRIFGAYYREELGMARRKDLPPANSAAALERYATLPGLRLGVELHTPGDGHLMQALGGALRSRIAHYGDTTAALSALRSGEVAAILAPRGALQATLDDDERFQIDTYRLPPPSVDRWLVGMAVKVEAQALQTALENALAALRTDGSLKQLLGRHRLDSLALEP